MVCAHLVKIDILFSIIGNELFSGPSNLDCSKHDVVAFELNKGDIFGTDLWSHGYQIAEQELVLSEENDPCILPGDSYVDIPGSGFKPMIIPYLPKLLEEGNCSLRSLAILVQSIEDIFSSIRFLTLSFKLHPSRWFGKGILKARSLMETGFLETHCLQMWFGEAC
ncbi:hypothetical protein AMTR_s00046p00187230 [Amborella trichopoda]|uniref:Uncharacterized protein n=1 Tax=Amborella trichopoda TaxID=13333 RepID=U5CXK2_AMBTC|nr:hypothetical protein AMTR_s00046p00187230 [Amborella trichopoda]